MPGAGLTELLRGKAPSDRPALKPYWGKPAVRNFREDDGDVGIIRSPVRAIVLPDRRSVVVHWPAPLSLCPMCCAWVQWESAAGGYFLKNAQDLGDNDAMAKLGRSSGRPPAKRQAVARQAQLNSGA